MPTVRRLVGLTITGACTIYWVQASGIIGMAAAQHQVAHVNSFASEPLLLTVLGSTLMMIAARLRRLNAPPE